MFTHNYYLSERIIYRFQRTFLFLHLYLFRIWHFVGRLYIDTLTALVTDKIYFKCHTLLLPCFIPYAMKDIANIGNPSTHTHLIVDDVFHNIDEFLVLAMRSLVFKQQKFGKLVEIRHIVLPCADSNLSLVVATFYQLLGKCDKVLSSIRTQHRVIVIKK